MKILIFVTNTEGKAREAQEILGKKFLIKHQKVDLEEIQTINGKEVIEKKARQAFKILKIPVLVEDTSLYFNAWNGLPGALVRWFLDTVDCKGICLMMKKFKNRKAYAESAIAYYDGKRMKIVSARVLGTVPEKPRGKFGFGWDPIFVPKGFKKTYSQMTTQEKSKISMRKLALEKLRKYLVKTS